MTNSKDPLRQESEAYLDGEEVTLTSIAQACLAFMNRMKELYILFGVLFCLQIALWVCMYAAGTPTYTALVTIGPPNPSPVNALVASMSSSGLGGTASKLLGGGTGSSNDPFQQYQQLLQSTAFANNLTESPEFTHLLFSNRWDAKKKQWQPPSGLYNITAAVKTFLQRPVSDHPDAMAIAQYLDKNFSISQADNAGGGLSLGNSYLKVTLDADRPEKAEKLLYIMLTKADEVIRKEQLMDVDARMAYLNAELRKVTQADQRDIMIQILANQETLKATIIANKRYAFVLASPVFASQIPTKPMPPGRAVSMSLFLSLFLLAGFVAVETHVPFLQRLARKFRRGGRRQ